MVKKSAPQLKNFFQASVELMKVMARACGHAHLNEFCLDDLSTWKYDMHRLSGVPFAGVAEGEDRNLGRIALHTKHMGQIQTQVREICYCELSVWMRNR